MFHMEGDDFSPRGAGFPWDSPCTQTPRPDLLLAAVPARQSFAPGCWESFWAGSSTPPATPAPNTPGGPPAPHTPGASPTPHTPPASPNPHTSSITRGPANPQSIPNSHTPLEDPQPRTPPAPPQPCGCGGATVPSAGTGAPGSAPPPPSPGWGSVPASHHRPPKGCGPPWAPPHLRHPAGSVVPPPEGQQAGPGVGVGELGTEPLPQRVEGTALVEAEERGQVLRQVQAGGVAL